MCRVTIKAGSSGQVLESSLSTGRAKRLSGARGQHLHGAELLIKQIDQADVTLAGVLATLSIKPKVPPCAL